MSIRGIFWNSRERRLRAGWRLLVQTLLLLSLLVLLAGLGGLVLDRVAPAATPPGPGDDSLGLIFLTLMGIALLASALSVGLAGWFLDRRAFADFGFHLGADWWLDFAFGLALGALIITGIFLVELSAGWIAVTDTFHVPAPGWSFATAILVPMVVFLFVGIQEELVVRGYQLHNLSEGLNLPPLGSRGALVLAWVLTSLLFGLFHAANPNTTPLAMANLVLAGLFLGLGYILTGELALPIGLHITWNFFQGNVFGFPVSGVTFSETSFFAVDQRGPDLWTGGAFGPEGGLLVTAAALLGSLLILLWVRFRKGGVSLATSLPEPPRDRITERRVGSWHG